MTELMLQGISQTFLLHIYHYNCSYGNTQNFKRQVDITYYKVLNIYIFIYLYGLQYYINRLLLITYRII